MNWAEVAPTVAPVLVRALLLPLAALAGYFVAFGLVFVMDAVVRAFFGTAEGLVGWIPYAGRVLSAPLHSIEKKLTSFLGGLESHFENQMATRWHSLAALLTQWAADAEDTAVTLWRIARRVNALYGEAASGKLGARFQRWVRGEIAKLHGVTTTVVRPVKVVTHTVNRYVAPRLGALTGELDHVIGWDIPRLRARTRAAERDIGRLWKWTRSHPIALGKAAAAALVVTALATLGASWIRCNRWRRIGPAVCRTPLADVEALIGLLAAGAVIADYRELVKLGQQVERGVATVLQDVAKL